MVLTANLVLLVYFFYNSGGAGLTRIVKNYLIPNIPDKKYSWADFTDRGPTVKISGFYSSGNKNSFYLWTLSGLKRFDSQPGTSIYMFEDVCAAVQNLNAKPDATNSAFIENMVTGDILIWEGLMKPEYLVTVLRLGDEAKKNFVDKVWSVSGKYKVINQLTKDQCN